MISESLFNFCGVNVIYSLCLRLEDFEAVRELALNPIGDRIIGAFFSPGCSSLLIFSFFFYTGLDQIMN